MTDDSRQDAHKDAARQAALDYHEFPKPGKLEIRATKPLATGLDLARAYSRLVTEPLGLDELVYLTSSVEWWPPALELHRTFDAARQFLEYSSLGGIGTAEAVLEWVDDVQTWLRPSTAKPRRRTAQYRRRTGIAASTAACPGRTRYRAW